MFLAPKKEQHISYGMSFSNSFIFKNLELLPDSSPFLLLISFSLMNCKHFHMIIAVINELTRFLNVTRFIFDNEIVF